MIIPKGEAKEIEKLRWLFGWILVWRISWKYISNTTEEIWVVAEYYMILGSYW